jgi:hypothetical protein
MILINQIHQDIRDKKKWGSEKDYGFGRCQETLNVVETWIQSKDLLYLLMVYLKPSRNMKKPKKPMCEMWQHKMLGHERNSKVWYVQEE